MKKIPFILLAVGLPVGVATLANPGDVSIGDWSAMTILAPVSYTHLTLPTNHPV